MFLDVQNAGQKRIRHAGGDYLKRNFEVIFVTAHNEYMLQALQFSAVDYLMKPVDEDRLVEAIQTGEEKIEAVKDNPGQAETLLHNINKVGLSAGNAALSAHVKRVYYCKT